MLRALLAESTWDAVYDVAGTGSGIASIVFLLVGLVLAVRRRRLPSMPRSVP